MSNNLQVTRTKKLTVGHQTAISIGVPYVLCRVSAMRRENYLQNKLTEVLGNTSSQD